jgi:hypothetical protein
MCASRSSVVNGVVRKRSLEESKSEEACLTFEWEFFRATDEREAVLVLVAVDVFRMILILSIVHLERREIWRFSRDSGRFSRYILHRKGDWKEVFSKVFASG